jgi:hypothetical protein
MPGAKTGHDAYRAYLSIPGGADLWMPRPFGPDDAIFCLARTGVRECEGLAFDSGKPLRPHEP